MRLEIIKEEPFCIQTERVQMSACFCETHIHIYSIQVLQIFLFVLID